MYAVATVTGAISRYLLTGMHHTTREGQAAIAGLVERAQMSKSDRKRLMDVAALVQAEAETWRDGWAVWDGEKYTWPHDAHDAWARQRFDKLERAAASLRQLAKH